MRKLTIFAIAAAAALAFAGPAGATIINLDGVANASTDGSNAESVSLAAGTYNVTFTQGDYTAFNRWNTTTDCDSNGTFCTRGWENSAVIRVGSQTYLFGDSGGNGGVGSSPDSSYFASAAQSFAHSAIYSQQFTLGAAGNVSFFIGDNNLTDNTGGVSLAITRVSVPEPAGLPLLLVGCGVLGLLAWRRRKTAA